jgi:hypothetical protein
LQSYYFGANDESVYSKVLREKKDTISFQKEKQKEGRHLAAYSKIGQPWTEMTRFLQNV